MKLKIKIKRFRNIEGKPLVSLPKIIKKGDWVDLCAAQEMVLNAPQAGTLKGHDVKHRDVVSEVTYIPLGVAMQLPAGFEAVMVSRSSAPKKLGVMMANNFAVIDNSYSGNNDQWMLPVVTLRKTSIAQNTRICQFRIQLSQKATFWQKVRWFLSSGIALTEVESLDNDSRMGLGEGTGYNKL
jgi:dUTP pyrophosphatase